MAEPGKAQGAKMSLPFSRRASSTSCCQRDRYRPLLVGSFAKGKVRNGLLRAIVMFGFSAVAFPLLA